MTKVLLVEDSPTQALRTRIALQSQGFEVTVANESKTAVDVAKAEHPDVVLSDVRMPGLDGFQLCEAFSLDPDLQATPVLLNSATVNDEEDRTLALSLGAKGYIEKGLAPAALAAALHEAIASNG